MKPGRRAQFTRWYFRADFDPERCPFWTRPLFRKLFDYDLYFFMAMRQEYWQPKEKRGAKLLKCAANWIFALPASREGR